jgi:hypothetical protein
MGGLPEPKSPPSCAGPADSRSARRNHVVSKHDDEISVRPGLIRHVRSRGRRPQAFVGEVIRAAKRAGHTGSSFAGS